MRVGIAVVALCVIPALARGVVLGNVGDKEPVDPLCPVCEELLPKGLQALSSNATSREISAALVKVCDVIPLEKVKTSCESVARQLPSGIAKGTGTLLEKYTVREVCSALGVCDVNCCLFPDIPEQVRTSVTGNAGEIRVTWATFLPLKGGPLAMFDVIPPEDGGGFNMSSPTLRKAGSNDSWTYEALGWRGMMHSVVLTGLQPGQRYYYLVGDAAGGKGWSQPALHVVGPPAPGALPGGRPLRIAAVGDMGASDVSDNTVERIAARRITGDLDLVLHFGDISYADLRSKFWDNFQRKVEPIAAYVPYMTTPGNHESLVDFVSYANRFGRVMPRAEAAAAAAAAREATVTATTTPKPGEMYYSFDHGPVHVLVLNTEETEDFAANISPGTAQHSFIAADLQRANANRAAVPWVVVMSHRPYYCSTGGSHSVNTGCSVVGPRFLSWLEKIFIDNKVDLVIAGHRHNYEATHAGVQFGKVVGQGPTYVVSGNAGCDEHLQGFTPSPPPTTRVRIKKYGFSLIDVDASTLLFRHVSSDTGEVLDSFNLTRSNV